MSYENDEPGAEEKKKAAIANERLRWREFRNVYERCVAIADQVWEDRLTAAETEQLMVAELMRDRTVRDPTGGMNDMERGIPVPLFTPRDREQFIKEVAATLLISAERKNLTAYYRELTYEPEVREAGTVATALDAEAAEITETLPAATT